jgi:NAD(P)-dependent dehydrogenase (short-subunit alcohol dehydrogenase family)
MTGRRRLRTTRQVVVISGASAGVGRAVARAYQAAYCDAKYAIRGFTESLRCELLHDESRVRVTEVQMHAIPASAVYVIRRSRTP